MKISHGEGVALVAGGSGGIGAAIAGELIGLGLPVALTYRRGREAAEAVRRSSASPDRVRIYSWGSDAFEEAAALVRAVTDELGPVRYLVVASGRAQETAFHRVDEAEARRLLEANLSSAIALARAVATPMLKAGQGRIVLVGSASAARGMKGHTIYAATKAGLEGFTRSLAREAAAFGVTVNCVAPGFVDTPMLEQVPQRQRETLAKTIPLGRLGRPAEVAGLVCWLLSDQAGYVTGQTLTIDGGVTL